MYGGGGHGHHGHHGHHGGAGMGGGDAHGYHGSIPVAHTVNHHGGPGYPSGYPHNPYGGVGMDGVGLAGMHGQTFPPMHAMHHGFGGGPYAHPSQHPHEMAGSGRHGHAGMNGMQQVEMAGSGPRRQYSSDLSRLMSEFNANPSSSEDFLKSFLQRTASELDNLAQLGSK